ncbi:terminase [Mycobacterium marinum]|uniref:terminase n=1 Tax=Mycobacterium marinum TaxID=1781 RepID=UPI00356AB654
MPWQWSTVRGILSLQPPNEYGERIWTHRDVAIECTRQQGKTLIVVLLILFHLFVVPALGRARPYKIVYTAQRWSTAKDVFTRVVKVIDRVPSLKRRLAKNPSVRDNHGLIELKNGAVAEFAPRSQEFGRGVTELDILFIDEAYDVDPGIENDLTGAQSAAPNPQTIYLSTPPVFLKHPKCHSLADMHRLGHGRAPDLFYQLFAAPRHMSRDDPETWAAAQPSYGVATNEREIRTKRQKAKTVVKRAIFDADYCGWGDYPPPEREEDTEITAEVWQAMDTAVVGAPTLIGNPTIGLHLDSSSGTWRITAAWPTEEGRAHLELGSLVAATPVVVRAVVDLVTAWDPAAVAIKTRSDAAAIAPELIKAGVEPEMADASRWSQWCGSFLNGARAGKFSHCDQAELNDGVSAAVRRDMPAGGFIWDEAAAGGYAAALVSATLAYGALLEFGSTAEPMPAAPVVVHADRRRAGSGETDLMNMAF